MKNAYRTLMLTVATMAVIAPASAHDSTRHDRYSDHTHTERNMMDDGARTAGREGLYMSNNEDSAYGYRNRTYVDADADTRYYQSKRHTVKVRTGFDSHLGADLNRNQVMMVQRELRNNGYNVSVDGVVGPQTRSALRSYQRDNKLYVSGNVDTDTIVYMRDNYNANRMARVDTRAGYVANNHSRLSTRNYGRINAEQAYFVQSRLGARGYNANANALANASSSAAIRDFQRDNNLAVTGRLNEQTLAALNINVR
jgi:peptidoglycan hydrolase-like protein with peptidoglycan-binding domain